MYAWVTCKWEKWRKKTKPTEFHSKVEICFKCLVSSTVVHVVNKQTNERTKNWIYYALHMRNKKVPLPFSKATRELLFFAVFVSHKFQSSDIWDGMSRAWIVKIPKMVISDQWNWQGTQIGNDLMVISVHNALSFCSSYHWRDLLMLFHWENKIYFIFFLFRSIRFHFSLVNSLQPFYQKKKPVNKWKQTRNSNKECLLPLIVETHIEIKIHQKMNIQKAIISMNFCQISLSLFFFCLSLSSRPCHSICVQYG